MTDEELKTLFKKMYFRARIRSIWCFIVGHDKYFNHPNKHSWGCARCSLGPDNDWPVCVYEKEKK